MKSIKYWIAPLMSLALLSTTFGCGAFDDEIDDCRESCDSQKKWGCYEASEFNECYDKCDAASSSAISRFNACVDATALCDDDCTLDVDEE